MKKTLFSQLKTRVIKQEIGYLESVAESNTTPEEFQEYQVDTLSPIKDLFQLASNVEELGEILENELGIDNPLLYLLNNYIMEN